VSDITPQWVKMNPFEAAARLNELKRENAELEEHIDRCERLLRCWCKPRGFSDTEDLREETRSFLHIDR
jgi:hypothetical protein